MKHALVTGGNRGLGLALVETLASEGWTVCATTRDVSQAPKIAHVDWYKLDLAYEDSVAGLAQDLLQRGVPLNLLVHNAGFNPKDRKDDPGYFASTFSIDAFSAQNTAEALWINALMPMQLTSALLPILHDEAVILGISSWLGSIGGKANPGHYGYAGSKALLNMCLKGLALEFANTEKSVVAFNPGWMKTDMGGDNAKRHPKDVARSIVDLLDRGLLHASNGGFINEDGTEHPW